MNIEEQFDLWESELTFRERAEFAMEFIEQTQQAYGTTIRTDKEADCSLIWFDLQTEFRNWLYEFYVNMEDREDEAPDEDDSFWSNRDDDDTVDFHRFG